MNGGGAGLVGGQGNGGGQRNASGSSDVTMEAAFQNAPLTPRIAEMGLGLPSGARQGDGFLGVAGKGGEDMVRKTSGGSGSGVGSSMGRVENYSEGNAMYDRFKVGMSSLMNVGGRSSWVGL